MEFAGWNFWETCLKGAETQLVYVGFVFGFCLLSTALPPFSYLELGLDVWGWSSHRVTMRRNATQEEGGELQFRWGWALEDIYQPRDFMFHKKNKARCS